MDAVTPGRAANTQENIGVTPGISVLAFFVFLWIPLSFRAQKAMQNHLRQTSHGREDTLLSISSPQMLLRCHMGRPRG